MQVDRAGRSKDFAETEYYLIRGRMTRKPTLRVDLASQNVGSTSDLKSPVAPSQSISEGLWQGRRCFRSRIDASESRFVRLRGL